MHTAKNTRQGKESCLHKHTALGLKAALLLRPGVAVLNIPQHLGVPQGRKQYPVLVSVDASAAILSCKEPGARASPGEGAAHG